MLFTSRCAGCNKPGEVLCRACRFALAAHPAVEVPGDVCAALPFTGAPRQVLLALKYRNRRHVAAALAAAMVRSLHGPPPDLVTWAPTSARRARRRGYDQAELLAKAISRRLGVPSRRLLYRAHGGPQTGLSRADRLGGPTFRARTCSPLRVLLVDDVVTTGSTLRAARDALLAAGVAHVTCLAAAATPAGTGPMRHHRPPPPVGLQPAWASSTASSAPVKGRS